MKHVTAKQIDIIFTTQMLVVVPWILNISIMFPGLEITILQELNFNILRKHLSGEGALFFKPQL